MFDADMWARMERDILSLPGGASLCEKVHKGIPPWPDIAIAMSYCAGFPMAEFKALLGSDEFDVRWPLTFAAWYWGASGASVDQECATFLTGAGLWERASKVLPEYNCEHLSVWRSRLEKFRLTTRSTRPPQRLACWIVNRAAGELKSVSRPIGKYSVGATISWQIRTPEPHTIRVQHAYHSARVLLYVDDQRILDRHDGEVLWDAGFEYEFHVDDAPCKLRIGGAGTKLFVNGQVQSPSG